MATLKEKIQKEMAERKAGNRTSPLERDAMRVLDSAGVPYQREYQVGKYLIDFAIPSIRVAIELDGDTYHLTEEQAKRDREKDDFLINENWTVIRETSSSFWNTKGERLLEKIHVVLTRARNGQNELSSLLCLAHRRIGNFGAETMRRAKREVMTDNSIEYCNIRKGYFNGAGLEFYKDSTTED